MISHLSQECEMNENNIGSPITTTATITSSTHLHIYLRIKLVSFAMEATNEQKLFISCKSTYLKKNQ